MNKFIKIPYYILLFLAVLGLIVGPLFWYLSWSFHKEYNEFALNAKETTGVIYKEYSVWKGRISNHYVSIRYNTDGKHNTLARKVKVITPQYKKGDKVEVLYHKADSGNIRIKGETKWRNLPPAYKPYLGMIYTFFSYIMILTIGVMRKRKNK